MKQLCNLQDLSLNLSENNIGESEWDIRFLANGIKYLRNLKNLRLDLQSNELENFKPLGIIMQIPNINNLELNLSKNILGKN